MATDRGVVHRLWVRAVHGVIAIGGVVTILGSVPAGIPTSDCFLGCGPTGSFTIPPTVYLAPSGQTVQVGTPAVFRASANFVAHPTFAWCRLPKGGTECIPLPDGAGATYTLASANLSDDGAQFRVTVSGTEGTATSGFVQLAVSSMPGVIYADGDFANSIWSVGSVASPAQGGIKFSVARRETGGNPGACRRTEYEAPIRPASSVRLFHSPLGADYYPTSEGELYVVDYSFDCSGTTAAVSPSTKPLLEQGGRRFTAPRFSFTCNAAWRRMTAPSLGPDDFELADGPPCGDAERCPDFSAAAAPIRFGLAGEAKVDIPTLTAPLIFAHGFDNWQVTAWRR